MNKQNEYRIGTDSAGERLVRIVGQNKKVLALWEGAETNARALTENSLCRVTALGLDAESVRNLAPYCDHVYLADLNDPAWANAVNAEGKFDAVVASNVLECLYEPLKVLSAVKGLLDKNGCIVAALLHAGYSGMHACLLDEDFEYGNSGTPGSTPIRFFGIKNIQKLFEDAGLKIVHAEFVMREPERTEFAGHWAKLSEGVRKALAGNRFGLVYQVVIKAVPVEADGRAVVLMNATVPSH